MLQKLTCRVPFTTTGLGFCVNDLYHKFKSFSEYCTIHQFYRYTLMQFELKCFKVHQKSFHFYPHLHFAFDQSYEELMEEAEVHKVNFASISHIIDSYGHFQTRYQKFCTVVSPLDVHSPHTIRVSNLRAIVSKLAAGFDKEFIHENTLPGAIFNADGVLLNPDSIMPAVYTKEIFCDDASAVELAFSKLNPNLSPLTTTKDCVFSRDGEASSLLSTWIKDDSPRDRIPPIIEGMSDKTTLTSTSDRVWYSIYPDPIDDVTLINYGILSYCGVWSKTLAAKWVDLNVRYPGSSKQFCTACWSTIFDITLDDEWEGDELDSDSD